MKSLFNPETVIAAVIFLSLIGFSKTVESVMNGNLDVEVVVYQAP